jgi:hypothetical protein
VVAVGALVALAAFAEVVRQLNEHSSRVYNTASLSGREVAAAGFVLSGGVRYLGRWALG